MLIALAGRKRVGKTTLANMCIMKGFQKISFADRLKDLVAELYQWERESLDNQIQKEETLPKPVFWNKEKADQLAKLINAQELHDEFKIFNSRREAMQFIGTEVLRRHDTNFHVNSLKDKILPYKNYVLDDVRFNNELDCIDSLSGVSFFIIRPNYRVYSNHASEMSLNYTMFKQVIVNDGTIDEFTMYFQYLLNRLLENKQIDDKTYKKDKYLNINKENAFQIGQVASNVFKIENNSIILNEKFYNSAFSNCLLELESLKVWNIDKPQVPEIIEKNEELFTYWLAGKLKNHGN